MAVYLVCLWNHSKEIKQIKCKNRRSLLTIYTNILHQFLKMSTNKMPFDGSLEENLTPLNSNKY